MFRIARRSPDGHGNKLGDKCKGLQARGKECNREADTAVQSSPELGDTCTAAQSWETHVEDWKAEVDSAVQSTDTCKGFLLVIVSHGLASLLVGHCVGLSPFCSFCLPSCLALQSFPFVSQLSTAVLQS